MRMIKKRSSGSKPAPPAAAVSQQASADAQDYYARHEVVVEAAGTHAPCLKLKAAPFPAPLLKLLQAQFETPTPIQAATWPLAATACRDVLAIARTGSGKTLAFLLPAISRLTGDEAGTPRCLVLVPTRELALQHARVAAVFCAAIGRRAVAVYGGAPRQAQAAELRAGADLIVATPGRLLDLLDLHSERASAAKGMPCKFFLKGRCGKGDACPFKHAGAAAGGGSGGSPAESGAGAAASLARCALIVLDEADMMLALGFERFIRAAVAAAPAEHQTLMLTATWPPEVASPSPSPSPSPSLSPNPKHNLALTLTLTLTLTLGRARRRVAAARRPRDGVGRRWQGASDGVRGRRADGARARPRGEVGALPLDARAARTPRR